jgi:hypothetical protein
VSSISSSSSGVLSNGISAIIVITLSTHSRRIYQRLLHRLSARPFSSGNTTW